MNNQKEIEQIIENIYKAHEQSGLFDESLENVLFKFTNAYDSLFLDEMRSSINKARKGLLLSLDNPNRNFDLLRHAYRACIKFAYESCKPGVFNQKCSRLDINAYEKELEETVQFNFIRNTIDRYRLRKYSVSLEEGSLHFSNIKGKRPIVYDIYSRIFADMIPGGKQSKDNVDVFNFNTELARQSMNKQEFQSKKIFKPAKHVLLPVINKLLLYYLKDLDIDINLLRGKDYYLGEYLIVYSYFSAIAFFKTAYLLSLRGENDLVNQPALVYPKERLVSDIKEITGLSEKSIQKVMRDMVYDYEFHKDKVTVFQPVFEIGDFYVCSCNMLFHSYIVDKVMKYFDNRGTNKPDLTLYHKYMSDRMNNRMADNLPILYPNLITYKNCILTIDNKPQSEIDLLAFDTTSKTALLIELKNYTPVDNDADALRKEHHINEAIESRLIRDKRVLDNLKLFFKQNKIPETYLNYSFSSLLVTDSYSGGVNVKEDIKVVDEALFYNLLSLSKGNLSEMIKSIETKQFFTMLDEILKKQNSTEKYCYKGITVRVTNE